MLLFSFISSSPFPPSSSSSSPHYFFFYSIPPFLFFLPLCFALLFLLFHLSFSFLLPTICSLLLFSFSSTFIFPCFSFLFTTLLLLFPPPLSQLFPFFILFHSFPDFPTLHYFLFSISFLPPLSFLIFSLSPTFYSPPPAPFPPFLYSPFFFFLSSHTLSRKSP